MNRAAFYSQLRRNNGVFGKSLSQGQVDGCELILDETRNLDAEYRAYILATAYHETAHTMQPVREARASSDSKAVARLDRAWHRGELPWVSKPYWRFDKDGKAWFGRGYVQLTHKENYKQAGRRLHVDLVGNPSNALLPHIAVRILVQGMLGGWFTKKSLDDYIDSEGADFVGARRVVNGTDRDTEIAGYANTFLNALLAGVSRIVDEPMPEPAKASPAAKNGTLAAILAAILAVIMKIFGKA